MLSYYIREGMNTIGQLEKEKNILWLALKSKNFGAAVVYFVSKNKNKNKTKLVSSHDL